MKTKLLMTAFILTLFLFVVSACKKTEGPQPSLIGKWKLDSFQVLGYVNAQPVFQTMYRPSNDYYDFRTDSTLYTFFYLKYDTLKYSLVSEMGNLLIKYDQAYTDTIKTLTSSTLIFTDPRGLYSKYFFTKY